jgi:flagellar biosynthesis protein FlhF
MRDAMRQVREHQGADAVILSSRRVDGMLEVVAALEPASGSGPSEAAGSSFKSAPGIPVDPELAAMRRELCDLRTLLMRQQAWSERDQWTVLHPLAAEFIERLRNCGFSEKLARSLTGSVHEDTALETAWSRLRTRLSASIATTTPTVLEQGGMLALVGSTGVGKTTTLSRLALRQIRRMGRDSVSLVTLDRQRVGAYKQLQAFGQMAGIPVMLLESERDLVALSSRAGDGKLILIDTEGQAARDAAERNLFAKVRHQIQLETWLVIPATHQAMVLKQVLQSFQGSEPSALVLTKVDEAEQLGETLSVLLEQHLGLVFYSDGQRIDEDFHKADTMYLTSKALQESARPAGIAVENEIGLRDDAPLNRAPFAAQTRNSRETMVLESVVPFRKTAHAAPH